MLQFLRSGLRRAVRCQDPDHLRPGGTSNFPNTNKLHSSVIEIRLHYLVCIFTVANLQARILDTLNR